MAFILSLLDNRMKSEEETKAISHTKQNIEPQPEHTHNEPFNEALFMKLNKKIKKGEATDTEEDVYAKLVPHKAKQ